MVFPVEHMHDALLVGKQQHATRRCVEGLGLKCLAVHQLLLFFRGHCRAESAIPLAEYGHERPPAATGDHVRKPLERAGHAWHKPAWIWITTLATARFRSATRASTAGSSPRSRPRASIAAPFVRRAPRTPRT